MKPTQEQILSALNELVRENKTELKAEKIELSLVDDLKDSIKKGVSIEKTLAGQLNGYNGLLRAGGNFKKLYSGLLKQAKELGVPVPPELKKLEAIADGFVKKGNALKKVSNLFG